jgi:hypothetical protein
MYLDVVVFNFRQLVNVMKIFIKNKYRASKKDTGVDILVQKLKCMITPTETLGVLWCRTPFYAASRPTVEFKKIKVDPSPSLFLSLNSGLNMAFDHEDILQGALQS